MKKRSIKVIAIVALLAICVTALVACNAYKWDSIGKGDSSACAVSNGGYFVKQGNFAYFINGYVGESSDGNEWGATIKGAIVRAEINSDGSINNDTTKVVVPKNVYTSTSGTGFAIFGQWIYYATYNYDKDKNGDESTTDLDFMRTSNDGSITQKIGTISNRTCNYKFFPTRVLYYANNTISYFDYSKMVENKEVKNGKGVTSGVLAENVASIAWKYADTYQNGGVEDCVFYTQTLTGANSYKNYNELYVVKYDGSNQKLLVTENSYAVGVYKLSLLDVYYDDAQTATLYYTKSFYKDSSDTNCGLYCMQYKDGTVDVTKEKELNSISSTTIFPLGYENGVLAYNASSLYCYYNGTNASNPVQVNEEASAKVWAVEGDYVYFTKSDAEALYMINYKEKSNVKEVLVACMKADWYALEIVDNNLYFYTDDDNDYLYVVNIKDYDAEDEDKQPKMIGIYLEDEIPSEDSDEE